MPEADSKYVDDDNRLSGGDGRGSGGGDDDGDDGDGDSDGNDCSVCDCDDDTDDVEIGENDDDDDSDNAAVCIPTLSNNNHFTTMLHRIPTFEFHSGDGTPWTRRHGSGGGGGSCGGSRGTTSAGITRG